MTKPAVFLDRDGTVIEHVHHLVHADDVRLISGAAEAIRDLQRGGYVCVIVTNQSVVGRGMLTEKGLANIHEILGRQLKNEGVRLDGIYHCPLAPRQSDPRVIENLNRKPGPGMLLQAAQDLHLELSRSWMIGDSLSDICAGHNAQCRGAVLVRTGCGSSVDPEDELIDHVVDDIVAAAGLILRLDGADHRGPAREESRP